MARILAIFANIPRHTVYTRECFSKKVALNLELSIKAVLAREDYFAYPRY